MAHWIKGIVICGLLWVGVLYASEQESVPLATGEWAPFTSESLPKYGAFTHIVTAVFTKMGLQPHYEFYPWKRNEKYAEAGEVFAVFPYVITDERAKKFDFSDPVIVSTGRFFYQKSAFPKGVTFEELEDLISFRIGGVLGNWYEAAFKKAGLNVRYMHSDEEAIVLLGNNRFDLVACNELVGWNLIEKLFPQRMEEFAVVEKATNSDPLRLMVSRTYPGAAKLLSNFNQALSKMKEKGALVQILKQYRLSSD